MKYSIELEALRTILFATLSCRCPVTEETERALFKEYFRLKEQGRPVVSLDSILGIADLNPQRTPVHNLFHFCSYSKDDPSSFGITVNDAIRYLCSKLHFDNVGGSHELAQMKDTKDSYHVSHMLLPVLLGRQGNVATASYKNGDHCIGYTNIFFPPELMRDETRYYAMHMGTVLSPLTHEQVSMMEAHLALIKEFSPMVPKTVIVDIRSFGPSGDHLAQVTSRFSRHYSL